MSEYDIVNRLRGWTNTPYDDELYEAADTIESLRAEIARLRAELEAMKCGSPDSRFGECVRRSYAARKAMGESDE